MLSNSLWLHIQSLAAGQSSISKNSNLEQLVLL